jgi:tRNA modification GTPase
VADNFALTTPDSWKTIPHIKISALYGNGLSMLKDLIFKISTGDDQIEIRNTIIPNLRHKIALDHSVRLLIGAIEEIRAGTPFELIAIDIQEAIDRLGEIIGITLKEDVINQVFSRFCIGK